MFQPPGWPRPMGASVLKLLHEAGDTTRWQGLNEEQMVEAARQTARPHPRGHGFILPLSLVHCLMLLVGTGSRRSSALRR